MKSARKKIPPYTSSRSHNTAPVYLIASRDAAVAIIPLPISIYIYVQRRRVHSASTVSKPRERFYKTASLPRVKLYSTYYTAKALKFTGSYGAARAGVIVRIQ